MFKKIFIPFIIFLFLTGCARSVGRLTTGNKPADSGIANKNMNNKKVLMVIAPRDFRDAEYNEPRAIFDANGLAVDVASIQSGQSIGAEGTIVKIDLTVSEADVSAYNTVVFIGGPGMAEIVNDESLQGLAKKFYQANKITAAICVAPAILAYAGILDGKQATAWSGVKSELIKAGAKFVDEPVIRDGNIITANGPSAARAFGEAVVEALAE